MTAYYNEIDPFAAAWLRELIKHGHIAPGEVDERSITDVRAADLVGFTQVHLFAGIGGWSLAARLAGWPDDRPLWTGSAPCQPFSSAGKQRGADDERHLWPIMRDLIAECRPAIVAGEQVASRLGLDWLASVRSDLEAEGYAVGAADLCAAGIGAPHIRQRLYWGATYPSCIGVSRLRETGRASEVRPWGAFGPMDLQSILDSPFDPRHSDGRPRALALADGVPARLGRLRGYGNAIVPQVAATFLRALVDSL